MRDKNTSTLDFKRYLKEISFLMGYELTRHLPLTTRPVQTPVEQMTAPVLKDELPVIVPILRAGLGMSDGLQELMPESSVGHIGVYRDEATHRPHEYLVRLPEPRGRAFIVTDPMLATGYSAVHAFGVMIARGIESSRISFMCLLSAPEGVRVIEQAYPDIPVYTAALDRQLNDQAYICPGLGDAGDRLFGTY
jgi:uracil phosphoribosyltransferase